MDRDSVPVFDETLDCVECGGTCHLLMGPGPDDEVLDGDVLAYRCADCNDRFDVVVGDAGSG